MYCSLFVARCLLRVDECVLSVVWYMMSGACCVFDVCCLLSVARCVLFVVC